MKIRKANKTNKNELQTLMNKFNSYRKNIFSLENKEFHKRTTPYSLLEDKDFDKGLFFVALDDSEKIVGFIQGTVEQRKNYKLSKLGHIDRLYIKDSFRRKGIARNLFLELEKELRQQRCDHLTIYTDFENNSSQQFYLQVGMNKATIELWKKL
ncbi:MAG: GNAT family N-acetyltransferase [Candidatus Andersenbacteria bacterium]|nr:GNAT family N-acetyltransferase [Candidatus Andersenbacteria bacterium]